MTRLTPILLSLSLLVGCAAPEHTVVFEATVAGAPPAVALVELQLITERPNAAGLSRFFARRPLAPEDDLTRGIRVAELTRVPAGMGEAVLSLRDAEGLLLASSTMRLTIQNAQAFSFHLDERCASVVCETGQSCRDGSCAEMARDFVPDPDTPPPAPEDAGTPPTDAGHDAGPSFNSTSLPQRVDSRIYLGQRSQATPSDAGPGTDGGADGGPVVADDFMGHQRSTPLPGSP